MKLPVFVQAALVSAALIIIAVLFSLPDLPYKNLWFAAAVACFIIVLFYGRSARNHERYTQPDPEDEKPWKNIDKRPSSDFSALIQVIRQESAAARNEEKREDSGKEVREIITICLLIATLFGIYRQVDEMVKVYDPILTQAEAAKTQAEAAKGQSEAARDQAKAAQDSIKISNRAWVGPTTAVVVGAVQLNTPATIKISIANTGREPAKSFTQTIEPLTITGESTMLRMDMANYVFTCFATPARSQAQIIYPSTGGLGGGGFEFQTVFGADRITNDVIDGRVILFIRGCLTYQTSGQTKHSSFCFFYKNGVTTPPNLNICESGADAD